MTELQQTELEILKQLDKACKELDIPYFLVCGSALGAVKYRGFIPWDDDIDVAMYREDYERFCKDAPKLLPKRFFLQNSKSDPAFAHIYSKLRDSHTTYIEKAAAHLPIHHGAFIDVFPLDGYPKSKVAQRILELRKRVYNSMLLSAFAVEGRLQSVWRHLGVHKKTAAIIRRYDRMIRKYRTEDSQILCNHGNWQGVLDYTSVEVFEKGTPMFFENLEIMVPVRYHEYLVQKYGNYMEDLPQSEQKGHHTYLICDCQNPYTIYTNNLEK